VAALGGSSAGKAMRENPAFEIPTEPTFDIGWTGGALATVAGEFEPGGEVRLQRVMLSSARQVIAVAALSSLTMREKSSLIERATVSDR